MSPFVEMIVLVVLGVACFAAAHFLPESANYIDVAGVALLTAAGGYLRGLYQPTPKS